MFSLSVSETESPGILGGAGGDHTVIETFNSQSYLSYANLQSLRCLEFLIPNKLAMPQNGAKDQINKGDFPTYP